MNLRGRPQRPLEDHLMKTSHLTFFGIALALTGALVAGCNSDAGSGTAEERGFADALEKANGDPSKLSPEHKKTFDEWIKKNPSPNSASSPGGSRAPSSNGSGGSTPPDPNGAR